MSGFVNETEIRIDVSLPGEKHWNFELTIQEVRKLLKVNFLHW
jgi:hypothetical protein